MTQADRIRARAARYEARGLDPQQAAWQTEHDRIDALKAIQAAATLRRLADEAETIREG